jgi:hypothetical protein
MKEEIFEYLKKNAQGVENAKNATEIMINLSIENKGSFYRAVNSLRKFKLIQQGFYIKKTNLGRQTVKCWWYDGTE